jgi:PAS domain S-box-containing protein
MLVALFFILRRQVQRPVAELITSMGREEPVNETGVTEFDRIGHAFNLSLGHIRERSAALAQELTERKRAEEVIGGQEARIRLLLNSTAEGIYGVDAFGVCTFCNPACCRLLGYSEADLLGRNIHDLIHHSHADGTPYAEEQCPILLAFQSGVETHDDHDLFWRADGTPFAVEYWSHPIADNGSMRGAVVAFFDITQRKQAEEALRTAWKNWLTTFDATADLMALLDTEGVIKQCNVAFATFCGREVHEVVGQACFQVVHRASDHIPDCPFVRAKTSLRREEMELPVAGKTYVVMVDPIVDDNGEFAGAVHTMHDISERKRMEEALLAERNKFESIIAGMGDGVSIQDRDYTVLYQNEVHQGFVGNHLGATCYEAYEHKEEICTGCPVALAMADGKVHSVERTIDFPDGPRHFEINASPLRDGTGTIVGGIELVRDATERKRNEAQLIQAQKMEGIGHLAGGVAHDFNNVLSVVQGYADLLRMKRPEDPLVIEYVAQIKQAVTRGSTITRQILALSRKEAMTVQTTDLNELVTALQKMLRRLVREDIDIQLKTADTPLLVSVDAGQIDQVLINLTTNACHAMPKGGTFRIETKGCAIDEAFIKAHGYGCAGPHALITISDTGVGMTEAVRQRIFEPFFTTKEVGKGTGLGLAMAYGIIRKHGGFINCYSEPDHGTVFRIYLPLVASDDAGRNGAASVAGEGFLGGSETILVAEDDPGLRLWLQTWLGLGGYTVIEAGDGEEAVQKFMAQCDSIHMVMLDGIMPRKNGKEALREMRARRPGLKAMIVSGYAEDVFTQSELHDLQVTFVEKPAEPNLLMRKVRQVLDDLQ